MIHDLEITNFRGLKKLQLNELGQINLLVGKNNCGKSSILESIFLFSSPTSISNVINIFTLRGLALHKIDAITWLFNKLETESHIIISGNTEAEIDRTLTIKANTKPLSGFFPLSKDFPKVLDNSKGTNEAATPLADLPEPEVGQLYSGKETSSIELSYSFISRADDKRFENTVKFNQAFEIEQHDKVNDTTGFIKCFFHNTVNFPRDITPRFHHVLVQKRKESVLNILKKIEPDLEDILIGADQAIHCDIGLESYLPLNTLGDGLIRIFSIILAFPVVREGILLIDEIENGLHHSSLKILWKAVLEAAMQFNVQVFATTHSMDCVKSIVYTAEEHDSLFGATDKIKLFRIERQKKENSAIPYNLNDLKVSMDKEWEVR